MLKAAHPQQRQAILRASPLQKTLHERHVSTAHLSPQTLGGIASVGPTCAGAKSTGWGA